MISSMAKATIATVILTVAGVSYPFAVYLLGGTVEPGLFVALAMALVAGRLGLIRHSPLARDLSLPLGLVAGATLAASLFAADLAAKAYPVFMSLGFALAFGCSLCRSQTLIERFARLRTPDLPVEARGYLRKVTWVWLMFLLGNAAVSAALTLWGTDEWWTLYNGLLSYLLMGCLFAGEWLVRQRVQSRQVPL